MLSDKGRALAMHGHVCSPAWLSAPLLPDVPCAMLSGMTAFRLRYLRVCILSFLPVPKLPYKPTPLLAYQPSLMHPLRAAHLHSAVRAVLKGGVRRGGAGGGSGAELRAGAPL